ncbi:MAG: hypothetical protein EOP06_00875 [Proteobacteria bacterium]|nr:MAG: hypothetical protein EOP06_00875 [Pseudomonadota bacterium]
MKIIAFAFAGLILIDGACSKKVGPIEDQSQDELEAEVPPVPMQKEIARELSPREERSFAIQSAMPVLSEEKDGLPKGSPDICAIIDGTEKSRLSMTAACEKLRDRGAGIRGIAIKECACVGISSED